MSGTNDEPTRGPEESPTLAPEAVAPTLPAGHPERIGRYLLLRVLGQGGMGTVYEAVQDHPRRTVALKVIRGGLASPKQARRFELEAELLGRLHHPGIAQVYEAGTADVGGSGPQPYFAMELIHGSTLTEYANAKGLTGRQRLALMERVCDAVQHAHERGIVHRDLKPSNILVDETGQPKILDFGVARATDADVRMTTAETAVGQLIGTLAYMSPEQVEADPAKIDGRSDVYALGVVTYELLTGRLPYALEERALLDAARMIREENPTPISTFNRVFRGDVETIVGKALEKDRGRRYASAAELGADLGRHLREEPILARPAGTVYQLRKFARRNKALVGGVVAVMVVLAVGAAVSTWQAVRATRETNKARAVQEFLTTMLRSADPELARGEAPTVREMIDSAAQRVNAAQLAGQPAVEGTVRGTLAEAYSALGVYDEARRQGRRAVGLLRRPGGGLVPGASANDLTSALMATGDAEYRLNANKEAEKAFLEARDLAVRTHGADSKEAAEVSLRLGFFYNSMQRYDEAKSLLDAGAATFRRLGDREALLGALLEQGSLAVNSEKPANGEAPLREALALCQQIFGPRHARTSTALWLLGTALANKGAFDEAEPMLQQSLSIRREVYGPDHPHVALVLASLGNLRVDQGKLAEGEATHREALEIRRHRFGEDHTAVAASLRDLGWAQLQQGNAAGAAESLRTAAAIFRKHLGDKTPELPTTLNNLALALQGTGDLPAALRAWEETLAASKAAHGEESVMVAKTLLNTAGVYFPMNRVEDAERVTREGLAMARRVAPSDDGLMLFGLQQMTFLLENRDAWGEALPLLLEVYAIEKKQRPQGAVENGSNLTEIGEAYVKVGRYEDARKVLEEARALREKNLPPGDWRTLNSRSLLGAALVGLGRRAEAEPLLTASAAALARSPDAPNEVKSGAQARLALLHP